MGTQNRKTINWRRFKPPSLRRFLQWRWVANGRRWREATHGLCVDTSLCSPGQKPGAVAAAPRGSRVFQFGRTRKICPERPYRPALRPATRQRSGLCPHPRPVHTAAVSPWRRAWDRSHCGGICALRGRRGRSPLCSLFSGAVSQTPSFEKSVHTPHARRDSGVSGQRTFPSAPQLPLRPLNRSLHSANVHYSG